MTATAMGDPMLGHALDGRYQITARVARGGMATVYLATDLRLTRTVAIKVMHVGLGDDEDFSRKFDREARAAAKLSHPNIVSVFDQGHDHGRSYIVMEYVAGITLRKLVNREAPVPALRACQLMESVLAALAAAHEAGLVHRDIKPENVLLSERGQVKVADFGLSKAISSQTSTATAGVLIGTVSYLPPELVLNSKADARSDVYSAGVMLYELLTGVKPHTGETPLQVAYAHVHRDVPVPSTVAPAMDIPDYVDALVATATARDPDLRPSDGHVFLSQLRRVRRNLQRGVRTDPELAAELTAALEEAEDERTEAVAAALPDDTDGYGEGAEQTEIVSSTRVEHTPIRTLSDVRRAIPRPLLTPTTAATPLSPGEVDESEGEPSRPVRPGTAFAQQATYRRRRGLVALLVVLVLTACATAAGWYVTEGRFTTTPALTQLPRSQVLTAAQADGLAVEFDPPAYSESVPVGSSISTDPTAGQKIRRGGTVHVVLSRGPERYAVPKLVGQTLDEAKQALAGAHLTVGKVTRTYSESVKTGIVISAGTKAGTEVKPRTAVELTVSKGREPITITSYTGKDAADAKAALTKAGFTVTEKKAYDESVPEGKVIKQSPADGTGHKGDTITLTVSLGPPYVEVPNVRSMGLKAATTVMESKGFKVAKKPVSGINFLGLGYVTYTDPGIGKKARKGSTITLYYV